jgi:hypothetical protein
VPGGQGVLLCTAYLSRGRHIRRRRPRICLSEVHKTPWKRRSSWQHGLLFRCWLSYRQQRRLMIIPNVNRIRGPPDAQGLPSDCERKVDNPFIRVPTMLNIDRFPSRATWKFDTTRRRSASFTSRCSSLRPSGEHLPRCREFMGSAADSCCRRIVCDCIETLAIH